MDSGRLVGVTKYYLIAGRNALLIYQMRVVDPETKTQTQCKCSYISVSQAYSANALM
jgi:hypothetical protein